MMKTCRFLVATIFFGMIAITTNAQAKKTPVKAKTVASKTTTELKVTELPKSEPVRVKITTDSGIIIVKLYDSTPLHRDNFITLATAHFFDSLMFHRVIPQFMIQGGDPLSKNAASGTMLGNGGSDMTRIPAEFRKSLIHKRGALAAARDGNPTKASSACQFYLVQGKLITDAELNMLESRKGIKYTEEQRNIYKTIGGTPMLDQDYTVFGEVESGLEVIDKIAAMPRDQVNRPNTDIRMQIEIIK
jgi:peptidyl-prolyl cis-trans isomerase B (cyclophilin B)